LLRESIAVFLRELLMADIWFTCVMGPLPGSG